MANDLNRCEFIGRLGNDVEIRHLPSGSAVANFSIAVGSQWKDKQTGEKQERTEWVNLVAFGKLGEICGEYLKKGSQVYVAGEFKTEKYEKDGVTRYATKVIIKDMQMLGGKTSSEPSESRPSAPPVDDDFDDSVPF